MVAAMLCAGGGREDGGGGGFLHLQLPFLEIRRAIWASQRISPYFNGNFPKLGQLNLFQKFGITVKSGHIYR